ncbi:lipoprotein [Cupriavidus basilensis]|uniref:lipoprotein n=1 Tax=Cupriavidus basilensis TaxID=68895 RepID=UPI0020A6DAA7|nr:hypothetical protein [Cupriavidus basilensis]MCP3024591.1 hypothetical protein [Cupriavidus basilensis]
MKKLFATITAIAMLTGCAVEHTSSNVYRGMEALHGGQVEHASVVRVRAVIIQSSVTPGYGAFSGLAGIAGAIVGSVVGSQAIGGGRGRYVAAAIAGPVAGIVAQQVAERASNASRQGYEIVVRTDLGRLVAITQDADQPIAPGDRVMLVSSGGAMRVTR